MLKLNVKSSNESAFTVEIEASELVSALKVLISAKTSADPTSQRLIYAGKVLKDEETLESYKLKDGQTLHLVKGARKANTPAEPVTPAATPAVENPNPVAAMAGMQGIQGLQGLPGMQGGGFPGMGQARPDPAMLANMASNPMFSNIMSQMLSDPATLQQMMQMSGMPASQMTPQMMEMMRNVMGNPQALQSIMQLSQSMGQGPGAMPNALGAPANPAMANMLGSLGQGTNPGLAQLLSGMQQNNQPAVASQEPPEVRFQTQLAQLVDMGFYSPAQNLQALQMSNGNVEVAIEWLFSRPQ